MEEMMMQKTSGCGRVARESLFLATAASAGDDYVSSSDDVQDNFLFYSSSSSSVALSGHSKNDDAPREAKKEADVVTVTVASTSAVPPTANPTYNFQLPTANVPCSIQLPASDGVFNLPSLQVPAPSHGVFDCLQDPFLTQLRSPWEDQHCLSPYAHLLYY
jgi:hypothetical protein